MTLVFFHKNPGYRVACWPNKVCILSTTTKNNTIFNTHRTNRKASLHPAILSVCTTMNMQTGTITTVYHLCEIWQDSQQQQQPPFYDHYTGQPAFTGTSSSSSLQHTHPFNCPFSVTIQVSRYHKDKTNLDFTETRDSKWQWHQLGHMQVCTSLQR